MIQRIVRMLFPRTKIGMGFRASEYGVRYAELPAWLRTNGYKEVSRIESDIDEPFGLY